MRKLLFYFAATGWTLSLIAHFLSLADFDIEDRVPFIWLLHLGLFVVWIPIVFGLKNDVDFKAFQQSSITKRMNPFVVFRVIFRNTPTWLAIVAIVGFYYAIVNSF